VLPCFYVPLGLGRLTPFSHGIQFVLAQVTLDHSPGFVPGALLTQFAGCADFLGSRIITAFAVLMQRLTLEQFSGRATVHIYLRIIKKLVIGKDGTFLRPLESCLPQVRNMRLYPLIVAGEEVLNGAILAVCYYGVSRDSCCCLMFLQERQHQVRLVDIAGSGIGCRDDFVLSVNCTVHLVRKFRLAAVDDCSIRISTGNVATVLLLVVP